MASAVRGLSPVSITTSMPIFLNSPMASRLVGFSTSAAAIIPSIFPSAPNISGVFPSSPSLLSVSAMPDVSIPSSLMRLSFPAKYEVPPISAFAPFPNKARKFPAASWVTPRFSASAITASAKGCSLPASIDAAFDKSSSSDTPPAGIISVTTGLPSVMVPVLSITTVST